MFGSPPPHNDLSLVGEPLGLAAFGQGSGKIFLDNVRCTGEEQRLIHCQASDIGVHNCGHIEDAGVRCLGTIYICFFIAIALIETIPQLLLIALIVKLD